MNPPAQLLFVEELRHIPYTTAHLRLLRTQSWLIMYYQGEPFHVSTNGINVMVISKKRGKQGKMTLFTPLHDDDAQLSMEIYDMICRIAEST